MSHWRKYFDEKYIGSWDIEDAGRDFTLTIATVSMGEVFDKQTKSKVSKLLLTFREAKKGLICNKTNARTIAALHGDDADTQWIGKRITLFVGKWENGTTGVKVRDQMPTGPTTDPVPSSTPPHDPETGEVPGAHESKPEPEGDGDPVSY